MEEVMTCAVYYTSHESPENHFFQIESTDQLTDGYKTITSLQCNSRFSRGSDASGNCNIFFRTKGIPINKVCNNLKKETREDIFWKKHYCFY